jgi:cbb3-type cytochrome oxidase subunit 3
MAWLRRRHRRKALLRAARLLLALDEAAHLP